MNGVFNILGKQPAVLFNVFINISLSVRMFNDGLKKNNFCFKEGYTLN